MTLRLRLAVGFIAIAILLVGPLLLAVQALHQVHETAREQRIRELNASLLVGRLREGLSDLTGLENSSVAERDSAAITPLRAQATDVATLSDSLKFFDLAPLGTIVDSAMQYVAMATTSEHAALVQGRPVLAESLSIHAFHPAIARADSALIVAERTLRTRNANGIAAEATEVVRVTNLAILALAFALFFAGIVAALITRSIARPMHDLEEGMRAVARHDLHHKLATASARSDEFGTLAQSFDEMTEQLVEVERLRAGLVAVASHELKTPISVIAGYVGLLEEGVHGPINDEQRAALKAIKQQTDALTRHVRRLVEMSRFEARGGQLALAPFEIADLLDELEREFSSVAMQKGIELRFERSERVAAEVTWDRDRIKEALENLLSNSLKFTPREGHVELIADQVKEGVQLKVRDTGIGIPPEQLPRVFEAFFQGSNQLPETGGTGLGLSIAKEIVNAHGGQITCESTVGKGTVFTVTLPVHPTRNSSSDLE